MKKRICLLLVAAAMLVTAATSVSATELPAQLMSTTQAQVAIEPRADVIKWKFQMTTSGVLQKRRWNETRGYWVDPYWITVG